MKIKFDKQKSSEALAALAQNASDIGKKVSVEIRNNVACAIEKGKSEQYQRKLKKYNPLFPDEFKDPSFNLPNIIVIVDDIVRKGIDVCEGAIGWRSMENNIEILHLYDNAVEFSGIRFIPTPACNTIYYADSFVPNQFIKAEKIFEKAQKERAAELEHIAFCLGAKKCTIQINEVSKEGQSKKKGVNLSENFKGIKTRESIETNNFSNNNTKLNVKKETVFHGSDTPQRPTLKWFAYDDEILKLIEMRFNNRNALASKTVSILGTSYATMSQQAAYAIDTTAANMSIAGASKSMEAEAISESQSELIFHLEF